MNPEIQKNLIVFSTAGVVILIGLMLPYLISPDFLRPLIKLVTLIAGCLSALLWYRAAIEPIPEFPVGFDLANSAPEVQNFQEALRKSANLNRWAAACTAVAAAGAAYDWNLEKFWHAIS